MIKSTVNRCQPGYGASCSLCCGSHNYTVPLESIENILLERGFKSLTSLNRHPEETGEEKRFQDSMQCTYVGILQSQPALVSCMVYTDSGRGDTLNSFFKGTCKNFRCEAWDNLTDKQVLFAAKLMGDWYYYSLLIHDIDAVLNLCAMYSVPEDIPSDELTSLKQNLEEMMYDNGGE